MATNAKARADVSESSKDRKKTGPTPNGGQLHLSKPVKKGHQGEDLSALKVEFVTWLIDPEKRPKTKEAWAEAHDISPTTLSRWNRDDFLLGLLKRSDELMEPFLAQARANLIRIALQQDDDTAAIAANRELNKQLGKYPSDKIELTKIDRIAYVQPGALRELARELHPELRPN